MMDMDDNIFCHQWELLSWDSGFLSVAANVGAASVTVTVTVAWCGCDVYGSRHGKLICFTFEMGILNMCRSVRPRTVQGSQHRAAHHAYESNFVPRCDHGAHFTWTTTWPCPRGLHIVAQWQTNNFHESLRFEVYWQLTKITSNLYYIVGIDY